MTYAITSSLSQYVEFNRNHRLKNGQDDHKNTDYSFRYYIDEPNGVSLDHWERKQFDGSVSGGYGYLDPNGVARTVHYKVEDDKGFEAIIKVVSPGGLFYFQQQHQLPLRQPTVPFQHAKPINIL
ncbi:cuticle protein 10.9-like [Chironomus tepperi]|uniref:cuticle protein 10.9-like n=1 Tax=Chironomus tepperi TaxID=113505 RepID=UPI00391F6A8D